MTARPRSEWVLADPAYPAAVGLAAGDTALVHGTEDLTVDLAQSIAMRDALSAARVPVAYVELDGAGHGFGLLNSDPVNRPGICTTLAFLRETLLGQPAPD